MTFLLEDTHKSLEQPLSAHIVKIFYFAIWSYISCTASTSAQIPNQKASRKKQTKKKTQQKKQNKTKQKKNISREQCSKQANIRQGKLWKLHKKLRFADPVFITSGIYVCLDLWKRC